MKYFFLFPEMINLSHLLHQCNHAAEGSKGSARPPGGVRGRASGESSISLLLLPAAAQ